MAVIEVGSNRDRFYVGIYNHNPASVCVAGEEFERWVRIKIHSLKGIGYEPLEVTDLERQFPKVVDAMRRRDADIAVLEERRILLYRTKRAESRRQLLALEANFTDS